MQKELVLQKDGDIEIHGNGVRVLWKRGGGIINYDEEVVGGVATLDDVAW